jgi:UDP-N-acetylglucosamine acyltransferase
VPPAALHPTASIHPSAVLGEGVSVGPYAVIHGGVTIGAASVIGPFSVVNSGTVIGEGNVFDRYVSVGHAPQHLGYQGEETRLVIGLGNVFREFVTLHRGTPEGGGLSSVGDGCLFMACSHLAHDCSVGSGVILGNGVQMGGHVVIGDGASIGALTAVHQFARVGERASVGMLSAVTMDVVPFVLADGDRCVPRGIDEEGLRGAGFGEETIDALRRVYDVVFGGGHTIAEARATAAAEIPDYPEVGRFLDFVASSKRGVAR